MSEQLCLDGRTELARLVDVACKRLQTFEPPGGYVLAYSGGKDSDTLLALAKLAGVRFEAHYHATTIDPPEVVRHIRSHADVIMDRPRESYVKLVERKGLPSRFRRWCCSELKERPFPDRIVLTGVRWQESPRRKARGTYEAARAGHGQHFLHAIIEWSAEDVWAFLRSHGVPYCSLYDEGHKRIGCVMCPMSGGKQMTADSLRWPHIAAAIKRAFLRYSEAHPVAEGKMKVNPQDFWHKWLAGLAGLAGHDDSTCDIFSSGMIDGEIEP